MLYSDFQDLKLSRLGFGTMRLPQREDGSIDEDKTREMVRFAIEHGVNYFDTAYPYHGGKSELVIGKLLGEYPRESFYLADKYPGHQISASYDPAATFEEQLQKCGVDYFDFYLLHNVCEKSYGVYTDPKWGIIDYFAEQKRRGRIRHLGFSSHAGIENLREFLDRYGELMEFCQIQLNYLDWTLQDAKTKVELLTERNIPVWVMEPVRGGKLAKLPQAGEDALKRLRPDESPAAWCFRWLADIPQVKVILSGMSSLAQMQENICTMSAEKPLNAEERQTLSDIADGLTRCVPCTGCRYCCDGCPMGLDIPMLLASYNDAKFAPNFTVGMRLDSLPEEQRPTACVGCGACAQICPQKIDIPGVMQDFAEIMKTLPDWTAICREREAAANALKNG
ncbi:MAG: aldo/keto reductase [Oscillospiraceae bacterium]|nr:aldo/keto reductase [Oscillospiraceae bacterium]